MAHNIIVLLIVFIALGRSNMLSTLILLLQYLTILSKRIAYTLLGASEKHLHVQTITMTVFGWPRMANNS